MESVDGSNLGSHSSASAGLLTLKHLFGFKHDVRNSLLYLDENTVAHPAGHNVVVYRMEHRDQSFIHSTVQHPYPTEGVTALAISPNRKLIAVAERTSERGILTLYDVSTLRRKKVLNYPELNSREIACVCFANDGKTVLMQGGAPDWTLVLWNIEKNVKIVCMTKLFGPPIKSADFCPSDPNVVCVSGEGILRFFRVQDGSFRPIPVNVKREAQNYLSHTWLDTDKVVLSTDIGDILLIDAFEYKGLVHHAKAPEDQGAIHCLAAFAKGFICGSAGCLLRIFEKFEDARELYRCTKVFRVSNAATAGSGRVPAITNIAVSPSEECLVCCTDDYQVYTFSLSNVDILKEDSVSFDHLTAGFHGPGDDGTARITGIDVCVWKPIIITTGVDKSVRVWNYKERTLELVKYFPREALSVALHPSGLYCLVGFPESLKLASIFVNDIRPFHDTTIKACHECRFSQGGEYYAAASNTAVQVYGTYTGELVASLKGHNARVRAIAWRMGDRRLLTASMDGTVVVWNVFKGLREADHVQPRYAYTSAIVSADMTSCFASGSDGVIRHLELPSMVVKGEMPVDCQVGAIALTGNQRLLMLGTADEDKPGRIRARLMGHGVNTYEEPFVDLYVHSGPVTKLRLSYDGTLLFSGGVDGLLCMFEVPIGEEPKTLGKLKDHRDAEGQFAEEILVTKADLEEQSKLMTKLRNKVDELSLNNEYQLRLKDLNYKDKIKEITDNFQEEMRVAQSRLEQLDDERKVMEQEFEETIKELEERHEKEFKDLEEQYTAKMNAEIQRYQELYTEKEQMNRKWDEENQVLIEAHADYLKQITEEYDRRVGEEQRKQKELDELKGEFTREYQHMHRLIEEDADEEVDELQQSYEAKLKAEREATMRLKFENGIKKRTFTSLTKDVDDQADQGKGLKDKQKELLEQIRLLEKDIQGHKKEIREREETIADKDRRIFDLKKRNQELEKFKFVLDYKIKELRRQIEPREQEIKSMRTQTEEMDVELEQYHKSNAALKLMIGELKLKMDGLSRETDDQQRELSEGDNYLTEFRQDLHSAVKDVDDYKALKTNVVRLYKIYVQRDSVSGMRSEKTEFQQEYNRQRDHLEKNVEALKNKITKDMQIFEADHRQLVHDNVLLTEEINALRREEKKLGVQQQQLERAANALLNPRAQQQFYASYEMATMGRSSGRASRRGAGAGGALSHPSSQGGTAPMSIAQSAAKKEIDIQRQQIEQLEAQVRRLQDVLDIAPAERIAQLA